jgi:hypothetical protein
MLELCPITYFAVTALNKSEQESADFYVARRDMILIHQPQKNVDFGHAPGRMELLAMVESKMHEPK